MFVSRHFQVTATGTRIVGTRQVNVGNLNLNVSLVNNSLADPGGGAAADL